MLRFSLAFQLRLFAGGHRGVVTPVPIPNTEVKGSFAEGSAGLARARVGRRRLFYFHTEIDIPNRMSFSIWARRIKMPVSMSRKSFLKCAAAFAAAPLPSLAESPVRKWYKGNLHMHTLVSDGRAFPVEAALLYRDIGYNFVMFSDHNLVHDTEKWVSEKGHKRRRFSETAAKRFAEKYPAFRPHTRVAPDGATEWRCGTFEETAKAVDDPGRFLLMGGCEYNDSILDKRQLHCNVINSFKGHVGKKRCADIWASFRNMYSSYSRNASEEDSIFMLNHPLYWFYDVDPLILADVDELRFFEIDANPSMPFKKLPKGAYDTDKLWDFALAKRAMRGAPPIFAVGTDDTHSYNNLYDEIEGKRPIYGKHSFVCVAAKELTPSGIVSAMRKGDFYASTGVEFSDISMENGTLSVEVSKASKKDCRIIFYGTKRTAKLSCSPGAERTLEDFAGELGAKKPLSKSVGKSRRIPELPGEAGIVLAETEGRKASYSLKGDDLYVRAKVVSGNAFAWTQPLFA